MMEFNLIAHTKMGAEITICCSYYRMPKSHNLTINHTMSLYNKRLMMFLLLRLCLVCLMEFVSTIETLSHVPYGISARLENLFFK